MKIAISKTIGSFMFPAILALVFVSCQKDQNTGYENLFGSSAGEDRSQPIGCEADIPAILAVPEGNKLAFRTYATGSQIYEVKRSTTNPDVFVWVNIAPSADLYVQPSFNNQVGTHYAGPTWDFMQGPFKDEKVVATKLQAATVDATAVPWLLLKASESLSTPGNKVTYIQRVCTVGGLAPTSIPDESSLGQKENVPYTATYLFYVKSN